MTDQQVIPMKEWMKGSTLDFFKRNEGAMMVPLRVMVGHDAIVKVMAKTFEVVCRDAHYITIASRMILTNRVSGKVFQEEEIFKAEEMIHSRFASVNEYLDARINQARQKVSQSGADPDQIPRATRTYEAKCSTQTATEYLNVLVKADMYLSLLQYLWITGELSNTPGDALRAKLNTERDVRGHLHQISRTTTAHFNILRRICNGVLTERKAEREKQSERDKRRYAESVADKDKPSQAPQPELAAA